MSNKRKRQRTPNEEMLWRVKKSRVYAKIFSQWHKQYALFIECIAGGNYDEAARIWNKAMDALDRDLYVFTYQRVREIEDLKKKEEKKNNHL